MHAIRTALIFFLSSVASPALYRVKLTIHIPLFFFSLSFFYFLDWKLWEIPMRLVQFKWSSFISPRLLLLLFFMFCLGILCIKNQSPHPQDSKNTLYTIPYQWMYPSYMHSYYQLARCDKCVSSCLLYVSSCLLWV